MPWFNDEPSETVFVEFLTAAKENEQVRRDMVGLEDYVAKHTFPTDGWGRVDFHGAFLTVPDGATVVAGFPPGASRQPDGDQPTHEIVVFFREIAKGKGNEKET